MNAITTKHALDFESSPYVPPPGLKPDGWLRFRVGTCRGLYRFRAGRLEILSVVNDAPGNGHFDDVIQWFEYSARRSNIPLRILEIGNRRFYRHLVEKRGFKPVPYTQLDVEKRFESAAFR